MSEEKPEPTGNESGLIVQQEGKPQQVLAKFLNLLLNHQYGLSVGVENDVAKAVSGLNGDVCCVFVIQNQELKDQESLTTLSKGGTIPLFLILPEARLEQQMAICEGLSNMYACSWQRGASPTNHSSTWPAKVSTTTASATSSRISKRFPIQ